MPYSPLLKTYEDIRLNDLVFNRIDENGLHWIIEDIDGWWDLPESTIPDSPNPLYTDGSAYVAGRYRPRVITLTGRVVPINRMNDSRVISDAQRKIHTAVNTVRGYTTLTVNEYDSPKQAIVQVNTRPVTRFDNLTNCLKFSVELRAVDPRKYATVDTIMSTRIYESSGGRVYSRTYNRTYPGISADGTIFANNVGSTSTLGVLKIAGSVVNPRIEHLESGSTLEFNITLYAPNYLTIDLANHTVLLNDQANRRNTLLSTSTWFSLQSGMNRIRFTSNSALILPRPTVTITYRSAWLE